MSKGKLLSQNDLDSIVKLHRGGMSKNAIASYLQHGINTVNAAVASKGNYEIYCQIGRKRRGAELPPVQLTAIAFTKLQKDLDAITTQLGHDQGRNSNLQGSLNTIENRLERLETLLVIVAEAVNAPKLTKPKFGPSVPLVLEYEANGRF